MTHLRDELWAGTPTLPNIVPLGPESGPFGPPLAQFWAGLALKPTSCCYASPRPARAASGWQFGQLLAPFWLRPAAAQEMIRPMAYQAAAARDRWRLVERPPAGSLLAAP